MDFKTVSRIATLLSKSFAEEMLKLLLIYQDISASQAASRLDLHIKTAQDFLDQLHELGIVDKTEVYEKKRPYYRYSLQKTKFTIDVDISILYDPKDEDLKLAQKIRERKNAGATFTVSGSNDFISSVSILIGKGRQRRIRTISLTMTQGKFLYHLPFPTAAFVSVNDILKKAGIDESHCAEVLDIVEILKEHKVIEVDKN